MPPYTPIPLAYNMFARSNTTPRFDAFDKPEVFLAWIDLLGVSYMNHAAIVNAVKTALFSAAECSATGPVVSVANNTYGILTGTP